MGTRGPTRRAWPGLAAGILLAVLAACGGGGDTMETGTDPDLPGPGVRLSGTLTVPAAAAVDSDLNDVQQLGRTRNDALATAQALTAPVLLSGNVNRPGTGPTGANHAEGDTTDAFVLELARGDLVELSFARGTDPDPADLDLYITSADGRLTGASDRSDTAHECVQITEPGRYYLKVEAFRQAATYTLRAGPAATVTTGCVATTAPSTFDPGELVAQAREAAATQATNARTQALIGRAGVFLATASASGQGLTTRWPSLVTLPATAAERRRGLALLAGDSTASPLVTARTLSSVSTPSPLDAIDARLDTLRYAKALQATGAYAYVEPNWRLDTSATVGTFPPNDLHYGEQRWHHAMIELPAAMARVHALPVQPAQRPVIAVIDTGVMLDHPDLQPQLASRGRTFLTERLPGDRNQANGDDQRLAEDQAISHGTHVAGTAAAATFNGIGIAGVAPMARLMPLNVFGRNGSAKSIDLLQAMLYAAGLDNNAGVLPARRADVINLSMGSPGACSVAFQDTVNRVRAAGTLVVAAAGSKADNAGGVAVEVQQPANCAGVIAVGAVRSDRQLSPYANTGPTLTVVAPGGDLSPDDFTRNLGEGIFSTLVNFSGDGQRVAGVGAQQGSSMAAPQVSGVLALMRYLDPELSVEAVDTLFANGHLTDDLGAPGRDSAHGWGLIHARKAVEAVLAPQAGADRVNSGAATLGIRPARLDLGSLRDTATLDLVVTAGKRSTATDTVVGARSSSVAITLRPGAADASTSLHRLLVEVDRRLLPFDGTHALSITLTLRSGAELTVPVTLDRPAGSASSGAGWGPVHVTLRDPDTGRVVRTVVAHAAQGRYRWQIDGYRRARVQVSAGTDPDNDGVVCGPGEGCGAVATTDARDGRDLDLSMALVPWQR